MRNLLVLASLFLGSSLLATTGNNSLRTKTKKRYSLIPSAPVGSVSIVIDKSDYELSVYDDKGWYATYPVVFGNNSLAERKCRAIKTLPKGPFIFQ